MNYDHWTRRHSHPTWSDRINRFYLVFCKESPKNPCCSKFPPFQKIHVQGQVPNLASIMSLITPCACRIGKFLLSREFGTDRLKISHFGQNTPNFEEFSRFSSIYTESGVFYDAARAPRENQVLTLLVWVLWSVCRQPYQRENGDP